MEKEKSCKMCEGTGVIDDGAGHQAICDHKEKEKSVLTELKEKILTKVAHNTIK